MSKVLVELLCNCGEGKRGTEVIMEKSKADAYGKNYVKVTKKIAEPKKPKKEAVVEVEVEREEVVVETETEENSESEETETTESEEVVEKEVKDADDKAVKNPTTK